MAEKTKIDTTVAIDSNTSSTSSQNDIGQKDEVLLLQNESRSSVGGLIEGYIDYYPIFGFGFTLLATWEAIGLGLQFSLLNGGPASLVYGSILAGVGTCLIALSLGEMASIDPVVGAQYRWSAQFAPIWPRFWALFQGWMTVFAWICSTTASLAYLAQATQALVSLNNPAYAAQPWHITLLMMAFVVPPFVANLWFKKMINWMELIGTVGHGVFWIVTMVTLGATASRSSHSFVWGTLTNDLSGWKQPIINFGLGLVPVAFPLTSFDGIIHMSKEVKLPKVNVPRAMVLGVFLNSILAIVWTIVLLYHFGDPEAIENAPGGLAIIGVYMSATGSRAVTTLFVLFKMYTLYISLFNILASVARLTWAFSQNNGLPFSRFFSYVSVRFHMPIRALVFVSVICCLLSLINIGSTTAFNALVSLPLVALYISYGIPISFLLLRKVRGRTPTLGPFNLGRWGIGVNLLAILYIMYILSFVALPTVMPVAGSTMNYAGPLVVAVALIALCDWFINGRKRFVLPESSKDIDKLDWDDNKASKT